MKNASSTPANVAFHEYVDGRIWLADYSVRYAGMEVGGRTTVVRLGNADLLVHSPCPLDPSARDHVSSLGRVAHIIAPGTYHYLHVPAWKEAFPRAKVWLCPGLETKRPGLPCDAVLGDAAPEAWRDELEQVVIRGSRYIWEVVFFDRPSKTLIVTDLVENFGDCTPDAPRMLRFWWWFFRMWNRPKPAPEYQLGWKDKRAARESLERVLCWDFQTIVLSHGALITHDAQAVARRAWSPPLESS